MKTEKKPQHTPGPWEQSGEFIQARGQEFGHYPYSRKIQTICEVGPAEDWAANARLIAAAPDLLEAAKRVDAELRHECLNALGHADVKDCPACSLRAAIAKAEGR